MAETIVSLPGRRRIAFGDSNWVTVTVPAGVQQLDLAFEDQNGTAVLGYVTIGVLMSEAQTPSATDPKVAAYSFSGSASRRCPNTLSVALGANHYCSIIVV